MYTCIYCLYVYYYDYYQYHYVHYYQEEGTRVFVFRSCFDENGLFSYIGTGGNTEVYGNPHLKGFLVANRSSNGNGNAADFVGREKKYSYTNSIALSWMSVDLGVSRSLQVNHYCLRHGNPNDNSYVLRSWQLQACNDDVNWVVLREHSNDTSMGTSAYCEGHWEVNSPASNTSYRHFRILQTGKNSSGNDNLNCCGMELYGKLTITSGAF